MKRPLTRLISLITMAMLMTGCGHRDERLADFAEQANAQQVEQNLRMAELQEEVAAGGRQLVEADAKARTEFTQLHRDLQTERSAIGQQRDDLEQERRTIASQRVTDPLIAAALMEAGLLLACLLPLVLCWYLLRRGDAEPADALVTEILLEDLTRAQPLLLGPSTRLLTADPPEGSDNRPALPSS